MEQPGKNEDIIGIVGGVFTMIQCVPLIGSIVLTEIALKKRFDSEGKKKI